MIREKIQNLLINSQTENFSEWNQWNPNEYLKQYFTEWGGDTLETIQFLVRHLSILEKNPVSKILDFGCGPTPIISLVVSSYAYSIHMADYLYSNLLELNKWINRKNNAFSWDSSIAKILRMQGKNFDKFAIENKKNEVDELTETIAILYKKEIYEDDEGDDFDTWREKTKDG